ncbi:MAG: hypothetical protein ACP5N3_02780 [Candidatus Nanoarchaeia archaeon]
MAIKEGSRLWTRILNAVSKDNAGDEEILKQTKDKLSNYDSTEGILNTFLSSAGTYNPYKAAAQSRIVVAKWRTSAKERAEMEKAGLTHGTGISGQIQYDQCFIINFDYGVPPPPFGLTSITKIYQTWGSEEQAEKFLPQYEDKARQRREKKEKDSLSTLGADLESFINNPSLIDKLSSKYTKADLRTILNLEGEIKKRLVFLDTLINSEIELYDFESKNYVFSNDPSGGIWKWFEKGENIPEEIRNMYKTYKSSLVDIDEEERNNLRLALVLFAAKNRHVSTNTAFSGLKSDLDFYFSLPENSKIREKIDEPKLYEARARLQEPNISLIGVSEVFEIFDFAKMRKMVNGELYKQVRVELNPFLELTRQLYVDENGQMKEDSIQGSVPWSRIKETEFGRAHVVQDHANIKEFHRLEIITMSTEKLLRDINVEQFSGMMTGLLVAKRKMDYWNRWKDTPYAPTSALGLNYDITENFEAANGMTIDEFVKRADFLKEKTEKKKDNLAGGKSELIDKAKYKIYSNSLMGRLTEVLQETKKLTYYSIELKKTNEENQHILDNPLVRGIGYRIMWGNPEYITLAQKEKIEALPQLKEYLEERKELSDMLGRIKEAKYFSLAQPGDASSIVIYVNTYRPGETQTVNVHGAELISDESAQNKITEITREYVHISEIPGFKEKAEAVVTFNNKSAREAAGYTISKGTWYRVEEINENAMISNALVEKINEVYTKMFPK